MGVIILAALGLAGIALALLFLSGRYQPKETAVEPASVQNDVKVVVDEIKKLYDEKALLVRENEKLKAEIERLKKS